MKKSVLKNVLKVKQTAKEAVSDSSEEFIKSSEAIEELKENKRIEIAVRKGMTGTEWIQFLKDNHTKIHYFGLGFIQIKINDEYRVHVYCADKCPSTTETPHDHRYDFESTILHGQLIEHTWKEGAVGFDFIMTDTDCREGTQPTINKEVRMTFDKIHVHKKGTTYKRLNTTMHSVIGHECITLLKRGPIVREKALVTTKKGKEKVCPFATKYTEEQCWAIVEYVFKRMNDE